MSRHGAFTTSSALVAVAAPAVLAAVGRNVDSALFGAFGAAMAIYLAYLALRDGLREEQVAPWFGWSSRRRSTAAAITVVIAAGCAALGPLVSWVVATTLVVITTLWIWVIWLAWRA